MRKKQIFILLLGIWLIVSTGWVLFATWSDRVAHATVSMGVGLILFWVIVCGGLMYRFRECIRTAVLKIPLHWQIKFFCFTTILALFEEVITTTMTNLAPYFGVRIGEAYITASTNFFDVVLFHSVITFLGPFVFWALALKRYDISSFSVFFVWGISGVFAEAAFGGVKHFLEFGLWIFVYGLMIFLPAYTLPHAIERGALLKPKVYHYILAIFLPLFFIPLFTWIPHVIDPEHSQEVHF